MEESWEDPEDPEDLDDLGNIDIMGSAGGSAADARQSGDDGVDGLDKITAQMPCRQEPAWKGVWGDRTGHKGTWRRARARARKVNGDSSEGF